MGTLSYICNGKKFYLDFRGYGTTNRSEALWLSESQVPSVLRETPFSSLYDMQFELI